jgi:hypothetical protein
LFFARHREQILGIVQVSVGACERENDVFQRFFFFAQILGPFRVVPDSRVFQFFVDLF